MLKVALHQVPLLSSSKILGWHYMERGSWLMSRVIKSNARMLWQVLDLSYLICLLQILMLITHRSSIMGQVEDSLAHILYHSIAQRKQQKILGNRNSISYCVEVLHLKGSTSTW